MERPFDYDSGVDYVDSGSHFGAPSDHWDNLYDDLEKFINKVHEDRVADFDEDAKRSIRQQVNAMLTELGV